MSGIAYVGQFHRWWLVLACYLGACTQMTCLGMLLKALKGHVADWGQYRCACSYSLQLKLRGALSKAGLTRLTLWPSAPGWQQRMGMQAP